MTMTRNAGLLDLARKNLATTQEMLGRGQASDIDVEEAREELRVELLKN